MRLILFLLFIHIFITAGPAFAEKIPDAPEMQKNLNLVWSIAAASLVFFIHAGFTMVETGFTRAKNAPNTKMKNLMDSTLKHRRAVQGIGSAFKGGKND
jgi:Amt family ammonium transporter